MKKKEPRERGFFMATSPRVMLAPMQGVLDAFMREILTRINQYDLCITEFVRVVDTRLPEKTYYRLCPELKQGGYTSSGTPVRVQLLGQHAPWLAENAERAIALGSQGIDFNCGCPSKTVNGSQGGASLLKCPENIYHATKAIREAIGKDTTLSVKVRLGWDNTDYAFDIADAVQQGGADEITIHGRTKVDGYRSDKINWQKIGEVRSKLTIPVIANGEIFNFQQAQACQQITGCYDVMVARGALSLPNLSLVIKNNAQVLPWAGVLSLLQHYAQVENQYDSGFYHVARIKQWLRYLNKQYSEADGLFHKMKTCHSRQALQDILLKEMD